MPLAAGTQIGPFEVLGLLGAGGMGEVYRARDTRLKREVAIKVLPDAFARDPERIARFQREAEMLATLNHPNIGAVYGFEQEATALILELVEGPTLADRLVHGAVPVDEACAIANQIADALVAAHDKNVIPSRSETGQHQGHARRKSEGPRLRACEGDGSQRSG
jgi:serine/threonine protein kinase